MRFVCDQDVDARVVGVLQKLGHEAWTVGRAGLALASDDDLTVYAQNQKAVLITHDVEFSQRRRRNVIGRHLFLRCAEWEAAELLATLLDEILPILERREDIWVKLSVDGHRLSFDWK